MTYIMWVRRVKDQVEFPISCQSEAEGLKRAQKLYGVVEIESMQEQREYLNV